MPETPINHRSLFENACEGIYQTTPDGRFLAANPAMARILGFDSPAELIRDRTDIARQGYVRPEQREEFKQLMESFGEVTDFECEVRRKDGSTVWVSETAWAIRDANGRILFYEGFFEDISRRKASERMQAGQTQILEMIAAGAALDKVFEKLVALVETQVNGVLASVQLIDDDGKRLRHGAAPSLPQAYNKLVDGLEIGPENGSCGTAAWRKETVIVADVMTDPLWAKYRDIAKRFRIGACWSRPILSHEDELLGTFAMYYRNIRQPEINELRLIEVATQIARIAITRKKAEQALKLEQERFRFVTQATHDAIYDWDIINGLVWRNETYLILYGADDPSRKWWYDHVHPDDLPRVERSFETAFERRSHFWVDEYRLRMADGAYATVMDRGYIIYNADGEPVRKIGALTDITERKQTEAALRESQALYHSTVENMPAGVFRKDYDGRYVFVNSVFCKLKGMTVEEILGKTPRELAAYEAERDRRANRTARQRTLVEGSDHHETILTSGKRIELEEAYMQPDGNIEYFYVVKSPVFGSDGRVIGSQGFQFDITARKRAEDELFQSQQMLRTILDTIPQRVFWKDKNSVYVGCNQALASDCGYKDPAQLIGKTDYETKSSATADLYRADDQKVMDTRQSKINYEEPQVKADGSIGWLRTSKVPLYDKNGNVVGFLGTYDDITDRKRLEEQLRQAQKMDAFGQLAAGVAHDFNNILTVIQGNLTLLRMGFKTKTDENMAIEQAIIASERAANLTRQLLTFGRRQPMQPKAVDLNDVIANLTRMLQRLIGEHIALEARYAPGGAPIMADANMIEQVLVNLAVNSRDAMPKGGTLIVEIQPVFIDETTAAADSKTPGDYIRCSVRDNGSGIATEHLPHIFEPFFTTKDIGKGTGLGLATVFGIVQQHNGWVKVNSRVGEGTTFDIFLPRRAKDVPVQAETPAAPRLRGGKETILLVEDEEPVRELMRILLSRHGYTIHEAASGSDALKVWQTRRDEIDLLITDMVMPGGIGGNELAKTLCAEKAGLKVIFCSGYTDDMLGVDSPLRNNPNFLEKPFEPKKLLQRVRDCLDGM